MPPRINYKLNNFRAIRKSAKVQAEIKKHVDRITDEANASSGGGYVGRTGQGQNRNRGAVIATNQRAIKDNAQNNTLVRKLRP